MRPAAKRRDLRPVYYSPCVTPFCLLNRGDRRGGDARRESQRGNRGGDQGDNCRAQFNRGLESIEEAIEEHRADIEAIEEDLART